MSCPDFAIPSSEPTRRSRVKSSTENIVLRSDIVALMQRGKNGIQAINMPSIDFLNKGDAHWNHE